VHRSHLRNRPLPPPRRGARRPKRRRPRHAPDRYPGPVPGSATTRSPCRRLPARRGGSHRPVRRVGTRCSRRGSHPRRSGAQRRTSLPVVRRSTRHRAPARRHRMPLPLRDAWTRRRMPRASRWRPCDRRAGPERTPGRLRSHPAPPGWGMLPERRGRGGPATVGSVAWDPHGGCGFEAQRRGSGAQGRRMRSRTAQSHALAPHSAEPTDGSRLLHALLVGHEPGQCWR
jgi:hypothetical protein